MDGAQHGAYDDFTTCETLNMNGEQISSMSYSENVGINYLSITLTDGT